MRFNAHNDRPEALEPKTSLHERSLRIRNGVSSRKIASCTFNMEDTETVFERSLNIVITSILLIERFVLSKTVERDSIDKK